MLLVKRMVSGTQPVSEFDSSCADAPFMLNASIKMQAKLTIAVRMILRSVSFGTARIPIVGTGFRAD
ncbi:MAG TPA: hypothetical protein VF787_19105 [Thermoanaerobaculia bacterium]